MSLGFKIGSYNLNMNIMVPKEPEDEAAQIKTLTSNMEIAVLDIIAVQDCSEKAFTALSSSLKKTYSTAQLLDHIHGVYLAIFYNKNKFTKVEQKQIPPKSYDDRINPNRTALSVDLQRKQNGRITRVLTTILMQGDNIYSQRQINHLLSQAKKESDDVSEILLFVNLNEVNKALTNERFKAKVELLSQRKYVPLFNTLESDQIYVHILDQNPEDVLFLPIDLGVLPRGGSHKIVGGLYHPFNSQPKNNRQATVRNLLFFELNRNLFQKQKTEKTPIIWERILSNLEQAVHNAFEDQKEGLSDDVFQSILDHAASLFKEKNITKTPEEVLQKLKDALLFAEKGSKNPLYRTPSFQKTFQRAVSDPKKAEEKRKRRNRKEEPNYDLFAALDSMNLKPSMPSQQDHPITVANVSSPSKREEPLPFDFFPQQCEDATDVSAFDTIVLECPPSLPKKETSEPVPSTAQASSIPEFFSFEKNSPILEINSLQPTQTSEQERTELPIQPKQKDPEKPVKKASFVQNTCSFLKTVFLLPIRLMSFIFSFPFRMFRNEKKILET